MVLISSITSPCRHHILAILLFSSSLTLQSFDIGGGVWWATAVARPRSSCPPFLVNITSFLPNSCVSLIIWWKRSIRMREYSSWSPLFAVVSFELPLVFFSEGGRLAFSWERQNSKSSESCKSVTCNLCYWMVGEVQYKRQDQSLFHTLTTLPPTPNMSAHNHDNNIIVTKN